MIENPDYWNTVATVIPVIALTYATALKRRDWHRLKAATRRWLALYGAVLVGSMLWAETEALRHLQERTTDALDERMSFLIVAWAAGQVLAVPIAPLVLIAMHDLHPKVVRAKRILKMDERELASIQKEYAAVNAQIVGTLKECRLDGAEQVLANPQLVYDESGAVRPDYIERVPRWAFAREFRNATDDVRVNIEGRLQTSEKQLKKSKKRLTKILRTFTKQTAQLTDLYG